MMTPTGWAAQELRVRRRGYQSKRLAETLPAILYNARGIEAVRAAEGGIGVGSLSAVVGVEGEVGGAAVN